MATTKLGMKTREKTQDTSATMNAVAVATPVPAMFDPYHVIKYPLSTEKSIRQIEFENKLVFAVAPDAGKAEVKKAVEALFKVKVARVTLQNSITGEKKAYVKLRSGHLASDVSADLGLI